jgi:hypothetical protein
MRGCPRKAHLIDKTVPADLDVHVGGESSTHKRPPAILLRHAASGST